MCTTVLNLPLQCTQLSDTAVLQHWQLLLKALHTCQLIQSLHTVTVSIAAYEKQALACMD
jgi:hypothetical protein